VGIFVVIPFIRPFADWLFAHSAGSRSSAHRSATRIPPASIVLAIMVPPTISAVSRDALVRAPPKLREPRRARRDAGRDPRGLHPDCGDWHLAGRSARRSARPWRWRCWPATRNVISPSVLTGPTRSRHCSQTASRSLKVEVGVLMYAALIPMSITPRRERDRNRTQRATSSPGLR
jgi:hypothetical protein